MIERRRTDFSTGAFVVALLVMVGCGSGRDMAPVSGVVTVDDKPLAKAGITFTPVAGGRPAWATTDEQGRFELSTLEQGDGALVGEHVVTIVEDQVPKVETPPSEDSGLASVFAAKSAIRKTAKRTAVDPKYAERSTSDLRFTVMADETNAAEFKLSGQ